MADLTEGVVSLQVTGDINDTIAKGFIRAVADARKRHPETVIRLPDPTARIADY
jgi:hypothetical protein